MTDFNQKTHDTDVGSLISDSLEVRIWIRFLIGRLWRLTEK